MEKVTLTNLSKKIEINLGFEYKIIYNGYHVLRQREECSKANVWLTLLFLLIIPAFIYGLIVESSTKRKYINKIIKNGYSPLSEKDYKQLIAKNYDVDEPKSKFNPEKYVKNKEKLNSDNINLYNKKYDN